MDLNITSVEAALAARYDFIVVGAGAAGCALAARLSDNPDLSVLLIEAGGSDRRPAVTDPGIWYTNLGTETEWGYHSQAHPAVNNRSVQMSMGRVIGGGSSINAMIWARGHKSDFDAWAKLSSDDGWRYQSVLDLYRSIEDWSGPDPDGLRGKGGPVSVGLAPDPHPIVPAMLQAAAEIGIPTVADHNGHMMEGGPGGCAVANLLIRDGKRFSMADAYLRPAAGRTNLAILSGAEVLRLCFDGTRVTGTEILIGGRVVALSATQEVALCAGAINTPKILMLSGLGDADALAAIGIDCRAHLPGIGQNLQDHPFLAGCIWEYREPMPPRNNSTECTFFWKSDPTLEVPDLQPFQIEVPYASDRVSQRYDIPPNCWTLGVGLVRPYSTGSVMLTSADPAAAPRIDLNMLTDERDVTALLQGIELCRNIGNSDALSPFTLRELVPGPLTGDSLLSFVRDSAVSYKHQSCTARMGRDDLSVVDGKLQVHGITGLRIVDASIMPFVTTGNTMAPTVLIAEKAAADILASR